MRPAELMGRLFADLHGAAGATKAAALQSASLAILDGTSLGTSSTDPEVREALAARQANPAYWAAFTLIGAPD